LHDAHASLILFDFICFRHFSCRSRQWLFKDPWRKRFGSDLATWSRCHASYASQRGLTREGFAKMVEKGGHDLMQTCHDSANSGLMLYFFAVFWFLPWRTATLLWLDVALHYLLAVALAGNI
jgi:hypothetical protein